MKSYNWQVGLAQIRSGIFNSNSPQKLSGIRRQRASLTSALRVAGVVVMATLVASPLFAQKKKSGGAGNPEDWTHHHVVFSNPGPANKALVSGSYNNWQKIMTDPRFVQQQNRRSIGLKPIGDPGGYVDPGHRGQEGEGLHKDWNEPFSVGGTVQPNAYPAKWSFSPFAASCASDYVVYPTGKAGSTTTTSILAYNNIYTGGCTGTVPSVYWAYDTGGTVSTSPVLSGDAAGSQVAFVQVNGTAASLVLLTWLKNPTPPAGVTGTVTTGSASVPITAGSITPSDIGMQITGTGIPTNDSIASITGNPATSITLAAAATGTHTAEALTIVAQAVATPAVIGPTSQAASGCTTTIASATVVCTTAAFTSAADLGASITGTDIPAGATITGVTNGTTITISIDPTVHTTTGTATIAAFNSTFVSAANYNNCTAPCMTALPLGTVGANDTFSAPYYDYNDDVMYVGDDSGSLHQFTGVFNGTPAETTTSWPVVLNAANKVTSPVYDSGSGYVFVGDNSGVLYAVGTGTAGTTTGSKHGTSSDLGGAIIDAPLVDSTLGRVYVFVNAADASTNGAVFQFNTSFTTGTGNGTATGTTIGTSGTAANEFYFYAGTFDNVYIQSAGGTGNLWVGGNNSTAGGGTVYRIPIAANVMSATSTAAITGFNGTHQPWMSPISEFCNNGASACVSNGTNTTTGTDYIFFSFNRPSATGSCTTGGTGDGCVLTYNVSTPATPAISGTGLVFTDDNPVGEDGCWATGGIVIDNAVPTGTLAGASQIYFLELGANNAGGPTGNTATSTSCSAGTTGTPSATQVSQSAP